ncbi:MAG: hypothetical protein AAFN77_10590 [Planctomycetota bacterium]
MLAIFENFILAQGAYVIGRYVGMAVVAFIVIFFILKAVRK